MTDHERADRPDPPSAPPVFLNDRVVRTEAMLTMIRTVLVRMLLTTGFRCTRRYLDYHDAVLACLPPGPYHVLPLLGIHPEFQGRHLGEKLLEALHNWCAEDDSSQGVVLDTGNVRYLEFYKRQGYEEVGEVALGPLVEHVFFHPNPRPLMRACL